MKPLSEHLVIALDEAQASPLARYLVSMGATVRGVSTRELTGALDGASFLIERFGSERLAQVGCSRALIEARHPRLIHVSVTPFGSAGPRSHWLAGELVVSAASGCLRLTGDPDRPPVKEALDACWFHADMVGAAAAMAAHYERGGSGRGQHVDISVQEVALSRQVSSVLVWQFDRRKIHRVGAALNYGRAVVRCIWPLKDGWCFHTLMTGRLGAPANQALSDWMDQSSGDNPLRGVDWLRYDRSALDPTLRAQWEQAIARFFAQRTRAEIASEGRRRGINATALNAPQDTLQDVQLAARGFWREHEGVQVPGRFVDITEGATEGALAVRREPSRVGPLAGVRVLDFSWALVGSITTKTLGDLGAEVIKVETQTRPCLSRIDVQVSASRAGNFNDKPWFAHLNTSKRSLALDLKRRESREVIEPLMRWADLVVENFTPGTLERLGLSYSELARLNPAIVLVSGSVYGQSGPLAQEWGVDGTGAALSGRTFLTGWPDRDPVVPGALPYGDVIVPYVMAAAAALALQQRRSSARGCHIDASMYEISLQQTYEAIVDTQHGKPAQRLGNADPRRAHQAVYPARGEDRWIAVSCATPAQWSALRSLAGIDGEADMAEVSRALATWTQDQDADTLAAQLQSRGIEAAQVADIQDLLERDPQLAERAPLVLLDHPLLGAFDHVRTPMRFSRTAFAPYRAPLIGEHSLAIACEVAELRPERVRELEELGVFK